MLALKLKRELSESKADIQMLNLQTRNEPNTDAAT
jgi:hypothetical protein